MQRDLHSHVPLHPGLWDTVCSALVTTAVHTTFLLHWTHHLTLLCTTPVHRTVVSRVLPSVQASAILSGCSTTAAHGSMVASMSLQSTSCSACVFQPRLQRPSRAFTGSMPERRPVLRRQPSVRGMRTVTAVMDITAENFEQEVTQVRDALISGHRVWAPLLSMALGRPPIRGMDVQERLTLRPTCIAASWPAWRRRPAPPMSSACLRQPVGVPQSAAAHDRCVRACSRSCRCSWTSGR